MKRHHILLGFILLLALTLRLLVIRHHVYIFDDSQDYLTLAQTVLEGTDYQVHNLYAIRMPGYPVFLAGVLSTSDTHGVLVVQSLLGTLACYVVYLLGKRISMGVALVGALLVAVDPLQLGFTGAVLSENPFTLVLLVGLYVALRIIESDNPFLWPVLGLLWAVAIYLRGSVYWLIVPLGVWIIFVQVRRTRGSGRGVMVPLTRHVAGLVLAFSLMSLAPLPWNHRNTQRFGPHSWLTTLEGISLYEAVYPEADGGPRQDKIVTPPEMANLGEAGRNDEWTRRAEGYMREEPGRMVRLAVVKVGRFWSPGLNAGEFAPAGMQTILAGFNFLIFLLAAGGGTELACKAFRANVAAGLCGLCGIILLPLVYFTALHAVFLGSVRYRVPLTPLVDLLAAIALVIIWRRIAEKTPTKRVIAASK